jgi:hypothetical protein
MHISVDISGQITQKNMDSCLGCRRSDGVERAVFLKSRTKKEVLKKYTDLQVVSIVEKMYCILVYYCIKDILDGVDKIVVCRDVEFRKVAYLLPLLFSADSDFKRIKITPLDRSKAKRSNGHYPALKAFRRRREADMIIKKKMIEDLLAEFKR